ncbi:WXG100 family type VII secretion target [Phytohabitans kaempferiae]|uniref:WXG100 family type VII secretion target n=1 Tax=Phytohabitans kaempferiae TaxID=1620943 RepID=A0ABV6M8Y3_9ACTN
MRYDYDVLLDGITQMQGINRNVEALIEGLARETGNALDSWTGPAAASYNMMARRIEQNFGDMNTIVYGLAKELQLRSDDMKQLDIRSGNRFNK